ncbi:MAG TPA: carboxypeptidase M32 [Steroidobacteraceae bacterium]|nr:carboxypeptidase M32 [Steroidobacteraceae bacterium]
MPQTPYQQLEAEFKRLHALRAAASLLRWDAAVMMPRGSVELRGEQLAVLETESHAVLTAPKIARLLDRAAANASGLNEWQLANLRCMRREHDHAIAIPNALITRLAKATAVAESKWRDAKQENSFSLFAPHLEEILKLTRDRSQILGQALQLDPYDALIDEFSPGLASAEIDQIFATLSQRLPALIQEAIDKQAGETVLPLDAKVTTIKQRALALELMKALGFPFDQGRLDESEHPFTGGISGDVRITTRYAVNDVLSGMMGVLHETGHAMYTQGLPVEYRGQPVGNDAGMAMHESQSLMIEMFVGRSRPFVQYLQSILAGTLNVSGPEWEVENMYRLLTRVQRSAIRVNADELTYPVHIMLRYELERELLNGDVKVKDLPEVWNLRMQSRLGVTPANDVEGCMQDIHWAAGAFGYFPSYAIGAVMAGQLMEHLRNDCPTLDEDIAAGKFATLFAWLREHVHSAGNRMTATALIKEVTSRPLSAAAWLRYVEHKYLE